MSEYPSTSRLISRADTGLPCAIRNEINESWRISFSVSFATASQDSLRAPDGTPARAPSLAYFLDYPTGDPRRRARLGLFLAAQAGNRQRREVGRPLPPPTRASG